MTASPDSILLAFILDYCEKKGLHSGQAALRAELESKGRASVSLPSAVLDTRNSFLSTWFAMFWDCLRSRKNPIYSHLFASLLGPARPPQNPNDRPNLQPFARQGAPTAFAPNGYSQSRPPHHPGPQGSPMGQSSAAMASRGRAAAPLVSRNSRPPTPFGSVPSPTVQGFALPVDVDNGAQQPTILNVSDALGHLMTSSNQRPGVDVRGAVIANINSQIRGNTQQMRSGPQTPSASQNSAFMQQLGDLSKSRISNPDAFAASNRRNSADSSAHLRMPGNQEEEQLLLRRGAASVMHASKKRPSSANASLDSLPAGAATSSAALNPAVFAKNAPTGPKKRMRHSSSYPTDLQQEMLEMSQTQSIQHQARLHQHQKQHAQLGRVPSTQVAQLQQQQQQKQQQHQHRLQTATALDPYAQHQQGAQQDRQRGMRSDAHRTQSQMQALMQQQHYQHRAQQAQQQNVAAMSAQDSRAAPAQNRNKFAQPAQNLQNVVQRQNSDLVQQHQNLAQSGNSESMQLNKVDAQDPSSAQNMDTFNPLMTRAGQVNVAPDAAARAANQVSSANLGITGEPFPFLMSPMHNGNQPAASGARQSPPNRQRQAYPARSKTATASNRGARTADASAQTRVLPSDPIGSSGSAANESRRGGAPSISFPVSLDRNGRENPLPRNSGAVQSSASVGSTELLAKNAMFASSQRDRSNAASANGVRENGVPNAKTTNPLDAVYAQQGGRHHLRKNGAAQQAGLLNSFSAVADTNGENMSTKSDRQGGGTPSQRSVASGASAGTERRNSKSSGSTRRQRSSRGGRRARSDRNTVGAASPTSSRRAASTSMDQASLSSVGDNRGGAALSRPDGGVVQSSSRKSPKARDRSGSSAKNMEGQRQASTSATASNQSGRNSASQSKKRTSSKQRQAQQQMLQKQNSQSIQQKQQSQQKHAIQQKKQGLTQLPSASQATQAQNAQVVTSNVMQSRKSQPAASNQQKPQARHTPGASAAGVMTPQAQSKAAAAQAAVASSHTVRAQPSLDGLGHAQAQSQTAQAFDRAQAKDTAIGTQEFYDTNVNPDLDKPFSDSFLSSTAAGAPMTINYQFLTDDMDSGIGSMLDISNMNNMNTGLSLDAGNGFEDDGGIL